MNKFTLTGFLFSLILLLPAIGLSQEIATAEDDLKKVENYQEQIRRLMGFLEFSLNTLGSSETTTRDKEIIINESYLKAFLNDKVQIEDDLDESREILTYKGNQGIQYFSRCFQFGEWDLFCESMVREPIVYGEIC